jgi:hypothetical protein
VGGGDWICDLYRKDAIAVLALYASALPLRIEMGPRPLFAVRASRGAAGGPCDTFTGSELFYWSAGFAVDSLYFENKTEGHPTID